MATWIRQGTGTAPTATDAELVGQYALDNATAPVDFDPAAVTSVQCQWTITGSGFVDDSWDNVVGVAVVAGVTDTEVSQHPGNGGTSLQNESSASDHTDSTGIPTGLTTADWEAAYVRGDGTTVPDEWCLWNKVKSPDGSTLTTSALTVTITYTPQSAGVTVQAAPATLTAAAQTTNPTLAALAVQAAPAALASAAQVVSPQIAGGGGGWTLVDSDFDPNSTGSTTGVVSVQDGDLIVVVASERAGFNGTTSVSDDGDASNTYVEAPNCPIAWKPTDGTFRTFVDVWLKVANATDAGTLTVTVADFGSNQWQSTAVLRPGAGDNPVDLSSMIGDVGGNDTDVTTVTTASVSPSSATYLKLGVGTIKKDAADHSPYSYDQGLTSELENTDASIEGMGHGLGVHLDTESASQALTFTVSVSASRTLLAAYILIPEQSAGVTVQAAPAVLTSAAQAASPVLAALAVQASPAIITPIAQVVSPIRASTAIQASPAVLATVAQPTNPVLAALAIQASPAIVTPIASVVSPVISGSAVTVQATPATLVAQAQTVNPVLAALAIQASPAIVTVTGQVVSPTMTALVVQASPATLVVLGQIVNPVLAAKAIQASPALLSVLAQVVSPALAAKAIQASPASITVLAQVVSPQIAFAGTIVQASPAVVSVLAQPGNLGLSPLVIQASPAIIGVAGQELAVFIQALTIPSGSDLAAVYRRSRVRRTRGWQRPPSWR